MYAFCMCEPVLNIQVELYRQSGASQAKTSCKALIEVRNEVRLMSGV
jgi:hypothetical protein